MGYIYYDDWYSDFLAHAEVTRTDDMKYGLPEQKKYPMPDRKHVLSAIKFFNYVSPKDEETLAHAILARMKEYGIDEVNVGPDNRFGKYYKPDTIAHHQIKGAKHGVRRWQNEDGSWTPAGRLRYGKGGAPRGSYKENNSSKLTDAQNAIENGAKGLAAGMPTIKAVTLDCAFPPNSPADYRRDPSLKKRWDASADLGLKAVDEIRGGNYVDWNSYRENPKGEREWFLYEDQTFGMPMIADLINQGYTADQVIRMINIIDDEITSDPELLESLDGRTKSSRALFEIYEGNRWDSELTRFASACERVKVNVSRSSNGLSPADFDGDDVIKLPPPSETERRLDKTQEKLERLEKEKESSSYKKREDRKKEIERQLESLHKKTQKIRDNKLFKDKDPGFFARMNLKKEKRLEKELAKINTGFREHERAIEKLNIKKEKYEKKIEKDFKYDAATREAMRLARNDGYDSLTEAQKKLIREVAAQYVDSI